MGCQGIDFCMWYRIITHMSNVRYQREKLAFMMVPNPFHPANTDPNHKDYATNGAIWHTGAGIGLAAAGGAALKGARQGGTISDALKGTKGLRNTASALAKTKYGRIGLGLAGLLVGGTGAVQGISAMSKRPDNGRSGFAPGSMMILPR